MIGNSNNPGQKNEEIYICKNCNDVPSLDINKQNVVTMKCACDSGSDLTLNEFEEVLNGHKDFPNCNYLDSHENNEAEDYCEECQKYLCNSCRKEHEKNILMVIK